MSARTRAGEVSPSSGAMGKLEQPKSPMPAQHQQRPGIESKLTPRPHYQAPHYRGADKLKHKVALTTFVYFASEIDSSYITGEVLTLLGGETTAG
jgi:hypothetical protein